MSLNKYIGKQIKTNEGNLKIESAKFSGTGCGKEMEVIKHVAVKAGGFNFELELKDLEKFAF